MTVDQVRFVLDWLLPEVRQEWETTRKVLEAIPPGNLEYRPDPRSRTAPEIAWHIVSTEIWFLDGLIRGEFSMTEPERPPETDTVAGMVAWYEKTAGPYQHFSLAVLRAVENRRALARAANTGISGFVDPAGRMLDLTPLMEEAAVVRELPLLDTLTFYTRWGDVFAGACLVASAVMVIWAQWKRRRRQTPS